MILRGSVYSKILEMDTGISILTPPEYRGDGPMKVAYILHGLHGNNGNWTDYTLLPLYAREYRLVCVMPEVSRSFYTDMRYGQRFFTYVADELPEICRSLFNISAGPAGAAVIGGSMGGYGALKCAFSRPDRYGHCAALSSACLFLKEGLDKLRAPHGAEQAAKIYSAQLVRDFRAAFGPELAWSPGDEILELAAGAAKAGRLPRLYCACGLDDDLRADNQRFAGAARALGCDVTYEEWPGGHDWPFFDAALKRALAFCFGETP